MRAQSHRDYSDDQFIDLFESQKLSPDLFTHEAHLRLAWIYLDRYGLEKALTNIRKQLKDFVVSVGADDKYHETLTTAGVYIVYHFMERSNTYDFESFLGMFPRLRSDFRSLVDQHYGDDIFSSDKARRTYIKPELLPF